MGSSYIAMSLPPPQPSARLCSWARGILALAHPSRQHLIVGISNGRAMSSELEILNLKGVTHPTHCHLWRHQRPRNRIYPLWPCPSPSSCVVAFPLKRHLIQYKSKSQSFVPESTADLCVPTRSKAGVLSMFGGSPSEAADSSCCIGGLYSSSATPVSNSLHPLECASWSGKLGGHRFSLLIFPLEDRPCVPPKTGCTHSCRGLIASPSIGGAGFSKALPDGAFTSLAPKLKSQPSGESMPICAGVTPSIVESISIPF